MKNFLLIILMILLIPFRLNAITRNEAVSAAEGEANKTYNSAQSGEALFNNLFHPNYRVGDDCEKKSTVPGWDWHTVPNSHGALDTVVSTNSWQGAPYCYGGNTMGNDCQALLNLGYGAGAHQCHYNVYGENINNWAAGMLV